MKKAYSGPQSGKFWDRVNRIPPPLHAVVYLLGCALQDVEGRMFQALEDAEAASTNRTGRE